MQWKKPKEREKRKQYNMLNMLNQNRKSRNKKHTENKRNGNLLRLERTARKKTKPHKQQIYESAQICAKNKRNSHVRARKLTRKIGVRLKKDTHMRENSA